MRGVEVGRGLAGGSIWVGQTGACLFWVLVWGVVWVMVLGMGCAADGGERGGAGDGVGVGGVAFAAGPVGRVEIQSLRERAIAELLEASRSGVALVRANAMEGLELAPRRGEAALRAGVADENIGVRSVAMMAAGRSGLRSLGPAIRSGLSDRAAAVRAAAIFALVRLGEGDVDRGELGQMVLRADDPSERALAAFVLGELGDGSARGLLAEAATTPTPRADPSRERAMQLQVAEAMAKLGSDAGLQAIRAALFPAQPDDLELTALASQMVGVLGDRSSSGRLVELVEGRSPGSAMPPEVRMSAAAALGRLGLREGWYVADEYATDRSAALRAQAMHVYGWTAGGDSWRRLGAGLDDAEPLVRVAAAAAVLRRAEGVGP